MNTSHSSSSLKSKAEKKKVLLMGKSGSGKTSMRNIIFSNFVAKDVRRLGATIDVEHSQIKFLGNLILNLWDCGGQDAFTETYLTTQRASLFASVGVLIYVFDIDSRTLSPSSTNLASPSGTIASPDLASYTAIIAALREHSPSASVFILLHKIDLVVPDKRDALIAERTTAIRNISGVFKRGLAVFGTSIWDQSLYEAWGDIVRRLIPDLTVMGRGLEGIRKGVGAEEVILFEGTTFLMVQRVGTEEENSLNPYDDRFQRLSNLFKTFKHSLMSYTHTPAASHPFAEFAVAAPRFNLVLSRLTTNTYVLVVLPPGDINMTTTRHNIDACRAHMGGERLMDVDAGAGPR